MSPITGFDAIMILLLVGWPGLVIGAGAGAWLWAARNHPTIAAVIGGLLGLLGWVAIRVAVF